jgi:hypothetical protein
MQLTEEDRVALAAVAGVLEAFAKLNSFADCQYAFSVELLPKTAGVREAVANWAGEDVAVGKWAKVPDWEQELREAVRGFALDFLRGQPVVQLAEDYLFNRLANFLAPVIVWKVVLTPRHDWECSFIDLLFEREDRVAVLHFGGGD